MLFNVARKLFGSRNERFLKRLDPTVQEINQLEPTMQRLSDTALREKTSELKQRFSEGASLDNLLPEAFAVVREASVRITGMRHFDMQLVGGIVLHQGKISEMKTGEGKTLVATLPLYLNALTGRGVHLVTVNDYLARRDAAWMGEIYRFLGLSVGVIVHGLNDEERREAYAADITYGTNNEFGFDYLRDNMKFSLNEMSQRDLHYAIVDEVDSILIDEARTPLIISGPTEENTDQYYKVDRFIPGLEKEKHFTIDEKAKTVMFTEEGNEQIEQLLQNKKLLKEGGLYDLANIEIVHHVNQALRAHSLFERDVDYIVKEGEVVIIDDFTGRMMPGRRYSDGLHQALEAKEQVAIQNESQTLASITFQNYFRMFDKLAGMTGTADTEAAEFQNIYHLEVIVVPTNMPMVRKDHDDVVYRTMDEKTESIVEDVKEAYQRGQPVLVGTVSIERSEMLSKRFKKNKIPHQVLNAKHHEQEAQIIAQAGRKGSVTIATNMAGRGTDIQLGGTPDLRCQLEIPENSSEEKRREREAAIRQECKDEKQQVIQLGGLYIIGTERHESRRIDNQLRGRSGRQGDPGASRFYLSLQDDLMRIFGSDRMDGMLQKLGLQEGEAIVHPWINKAIASAQKKVEGRNFDIRKNLLKFDDVMNDQRQVIYEQRRELMGDEDISDFLLEVRAELLDRLVEQYIPETAYPEVWESTGFSDAIMRQFSVTVPADDWKTEEGVTTKVARDRSWELIQDYFQKREERFKPETMRYLEKSLLLQILDALWKEHLLNMDHLKEGIHLRGYAQKDPLNEYKREAFELFDELLNRIRSETVEILARVEVRQPSELEDRFDRAHADQNTPIHMQHDAVNAWEDEGQAGDEASIKTPFRRTEKKIGRNEPCPCQSGKKYKQCCGRLS